MEAATFEWAILEWFQGLRTPFGDWFMPVVTFLGEAGWFWIAIGVVLLIIPKTRRVGAVLLFALALDLLITDLTIKNIFQRARPFEQNPGAVELLVDPPWGHSFPSGHTAAAFTAVSALYFCRSKLWIPALFIASLVAISRLYLYVHFPTDVLGGMLIGIFIGWFAWWLMGKIWPEKGGSSPDGPPVNPVA